MHRLSLAVLLCGAPASAYPWMIRYEYTNCTACHVDPSGAGLLTEYGRAQQEVLVTAHYGKKAEDINPQPGLFYGLLQPPSWLNVGASVRAAEGYFNPVPPGLVAPGPTAEAFPILMVADLRAEVSISHVHAVGSIGFDPSGASLAKVVALDPSNPYTSENIVSREHWLGVDLLDQSLLIRAGRIEQPFGLRNLEHPAWVRTETRTDLLSWQQHGAAVAYNVQGFRAELMGIAGNFQLPLPDDREQGYSGFAEYAFAPRLAAGVSSRTTYARADLLTGQSDSVRQAHGLFARWAPVEPLAVLAEVDALVQACRGSSASAGEASFLQADYELVQGVHVMATGETLYESNTPCAQTPSTGLSYGGWLSFAYYFFSNAEVRVDTIWRQNQIVDVPGGFPSGSSVTVLGQLHLSI
jgi:hypothetical protein